MVYLVEITGRALRDLTRIYQHIEAETAAQAAQWFDGLEKAIKSLERNPQRAPIAPEDRTLRHLLYGRKPSIYRVIYAVAEDSETVFVLHIRGPGRSAVPRR